MSPGTTLTLRPFEPGDLPTLQALRAAAFNPIFTGFREAVGSDIAEIAFVRADAEQAELLEKLARESGRRLLVACEQDVIVGFVHFSIDPETGLGEIGLNAVDPAHSDRGIGTWMYEEVLERMKAEGARAATVGTGGDASHAPARRAYEKAGFGPSIPSVSYYRML